MEEQQSIRFSFQHFMVLPFVHSYRRSSRISYPFTPTTVRYLGSHQTASLQSSLASTTVSNLMHRAMTRSTLLSSNLTRVVSMRSVCCHRLRSKLTRNASFTPLEHVTFSSSMFHRLIVRLVNSSKADCLRRPLQIMLEHSILG